MMKLMRMAALLLVAAGWGGACTVPVFRFALDRWPTDAFGLVAGEDWKKGEAGQQIGRSIDETALNLYWPKTEAEEGKVSLLWPRSAAPAWSGKPADLDVDALISSPARKKITSGILAGDCAVWVLVECGDQAKDKAFAQRMEKRLKYLESVAAIPEQDPNDPDSQLGPGPALKVAFSIIRVKRDDPQEKFFLKMLAGPEDEGLLEAGEPFAGVVFGRGRVLGSWKASDLEDEGVDEITLFLLGACSCRVKFMNPGWDLLTDVDWDEKLMEVEIARSEEQEEPQPDADLPPLEKGEPEAMKKSRGRPETKKFDSGP